MANKSLFKSTGGALAPAANAVNEAGGIAYAMSNKAALAQFAATGCLNATFYASAEEQLVNTLAFCTNVEPEFIARTAIYARRDGFMKDMPALLCAVLAKRSPGLLAEVFDRVIDDARMLRNFVQIVRSGVTGRKSFGTLPKRLIQHWFESRTDDQIFRASVGNDPSLADVIKMVHPKPKTASRAALYAYLIGRPYEKAALPSLVKEFETFKNRTSKHVPDVPFQMLTSLALDAKDWKRIAQNAPWQATRMNLNTFARHGVFEGAHATELIRTIANRLRDPQAIARAKVFPYQLMVAYTQASTVPEQIREALQDAMEIAVSNVPQVDGRVVVCPDVSGSMQSPVTGYRKGATTAVRCVDIAALVAAAVVRQNADATVLPFSDDVVRCTINRRDSVMTNATKLSKLPSGGTNCSAPLKWMNDRREHADLVIYVSDNESWVDSKRPWGSSGTETMKQWNAFKVRNPRAKLVCIDIQPYATTQVVDREDVLNVGGFSDRVFDVIAKFGNGTLKPEHWVGVINAVQL